ncbi:MAG: hypothetical protein WCF68_18595 [Terriglobales bacterium]
MTRELIDKTTKQFQIDQRPYVWDSGDMEPTRLDVVEGKQLLINLSWINYGRSPALRESGIGDIFVGPDCMEKADRWFASLGTNPLPGAPIKERVIPQGIPPSPEKAFGGFTTIATDHVLSHDEVIYILNTDKPIAMVSRIEYYDGFGNRNWSDKCLSRFKNGALPNCDRHNEMH